MGNNTVGYNVLQSHNLPAGDYWYWLGVGILLVYALLFNNLVTLALTYLNRKSKILLCVKMSIFSLSWFT